MWRPRTRTLWGCLSVDFKAWQKTNQWRMLDVRMLIRHEKQTFMKLRWSNINVWSRNIPVWECGQLLWNMWYQHVLFYITGISKALCLPESLKREYFFLCDVETFVEVFWEFVGTWVCSLYFICSLIIWKCCHYIRKLIRFVVLICATLHNPVVKYKVGGIFCSLLFSSCRLQC